jgi:Helix-turn-helix domain
MIPLDFSDFMTVSQVAKLYEVDRKTVYNWINRGVAAKHQEICGVYYFYRSALADWKPPLKGRKRKC